MDQTWIFIFDQDLVLYLKKKWFCTVFSFDSKLPRIRPFDIAFSRFREAILSHAKPKKISEIIFVTLGLFKKFLSIAFYLIKSLLNWTFFDLSTHCVPFPELKLFSVKFILIVWKIFKSRAITHQQILETSANWRLH